MALIPLLISILVLFLIAWLAYWVITTFFPEPVRMVALAIVGVILLLIILGMLTGHVPTADLYFPRAR
jgi:hypothetical protein